MKFPGAAVLIFLALSGCAAKSPEVPVPEKNEEVRQDQPPAAQKTEPEPSVIEEDRGYPTDMTTVFEEKGIPDRVVNEGELTILVYEGVEGVEHFAFRKKGEFFGYEFVPEKASP